MVDLSLYVITFGKIILNQWTHIHIHTFMQVHCAAGQSRSSTVVMAYLLTYVKIKSEQKALSYAQKRRPMVKPNDGFRKILRDFHKKGLFKELGAHVTVTAKKSSSSTATTSKKKKKKKAAALAASRGLDLSKLGGLGKKRPVKPSSAVPQSESSSVHASVTDALSHRASVKSRRRPQRKHFAAFGSS